MTIRSYWTIFLNGLDQAQNGSQLSQAAEGLSVSVPNLFFWEPDQNLQFQFGFDLEDSVPVKMHKPRQYIPIGLYC